MANKNALEREGITLEELVEIYSEEENLETTAARVGISEKTCRKYLTLAGVKRTRGPRKARSREVPSWHYGCLGSWIRHHPTTKLPRRAKDISTLTGCTTDEVNMYLYRRRRELKAALKTLPDLAKLHVILDDATGRRYPSQALERGYWQMNPNNFMVEYIAVAKSGSTIRYRKTLEAWEEFFTRRGIL